MRELRLLGYVIIVFSIMFYFAFRADQDRSVYADKCQKAGGVPVIVASGNVPFCVKAQDNFIEIKD